MLRTVWRVEDAQGSGPFGGGYGLAYEFSDVMPPYYDGCWHNQFPNGHGEGFVHSWDDGWVFGLSSLLQYRQWFPAPCRRVLRSYGLGLARYEVDPDHMEVGKYQVLFERAAATRTAFYEAHFEPRRIKLTLP